MKLFAKIYDNIIKLTENQYNAIKGLITEGYYDDSVTPLFSKTKTNRELGVNPLTVDNGNHTPTDVLRQPSTIDFNGANFHGVNLIVSDNKFMFYKVKNFGTDKISSTLQLFGRGAGGEKGLRAAEAEKKVNALAEGQVKTNKDAIDTLNGVAMRNNKSLRFRTITSETFKNKSKMTDHMSNTFWEFSYDNGNTWYIMKPHPVQNMQPSKVFIKM